MNKTISHNLIFVIPLLIIFSCSRKAVVKDYFKELQIVFPADMELIFSEKQSDIQDYSVTSIYKLTFNQKNALLDEVIKNLCDSKEDKHNCLQWHKCDDYYSYDYENKDEGVLISVAFVANNNLSTLNILEVKI